MIDVYLQCRRDGVAAKRLLRWLLRSHGVEPGQIVTDKLHRYGVGHRELIPRVIQALGIGPIRLSSLMRRPGEGRGGSGGSSG
ncbi:DDE-type integrase/transposase/recombinase [Halioglobus sp.]|nr:DDE-type integrase/transposase/recombinase [Halioglobus sp.]